MHAATPRLSNQKNYIPQTMYQGKKLNTSKQGKSLKTIVGYLRYA